MLKPKSAKIKETIESRELELFLLNNADIWPAVEARAAVVKKHYTSGKYDREKAILYFYTVANMAAKMYHKMFCSGGDRIFSVSDRWTVAAAVVDYLEEEYFD